MIYVKWDVKYVKPNELRLTGLYWTATCRAGVQPSAVRFDGVARPTQQATITT